MVTANRQTLNVMLIALLLSVFRKALLPFDTYYYRGTTIYYKV